MRSCSDMDELMQKINLNEAVEFAARAHADQVRKGSGMPYIVHPMEAASICASFTDDLEVIAAAVLHDVVEDTEATVEEVRERFGERVALLVAGESEDKREGLPPAETWKLRKEESLRHLEIAEDPGVRMVCLGDKLSNIRSIQRDYAALGDELWQRFNQKDPAEHAWYYRKIAGLLEGELGGTEAWREYSQRVSTVFGPCGGAGGEPSGFGTLGCAQDDPLEFFGSNEGAFIDRDGFLHGLPALDALGKGVVICPSPTFEGCFYVFCAAKWEDNVRMVADELRRERGEDEKRMDPAIRARSERIVEEPPRRATFEGGLTSIPDDIVEGYGIEPGEELLIVGNTGYFEVWRKGDRNALLEDFDLFGALMGVQS